MMITYHLLNHGFTKTDYDDYDCMIRLHELHYLFWSETLKHFGIGVINDKGKKEASGVYKPWNIILIPKPIYTIEQATEIIKAITPH